MIKRAVCFQNTLQPHIQVFIHILILEILVSLHILGIFICVLHLYIRSLMFHQNVCIFHVLINYTVFKFNFIIIQTRLLLFFLPEQLSPDQNMTRRH